jgi:mono/diheme cytochrome c family protein
MTSRTFLGGCVIAFAAIAGCYTGEDAAQPNRTVPANDRTATSVDGNQPADPSMVTGVPCDVAQVLAKDCASCHGAKPSGGAPNSMMSYGDLVAMSQNDASMTIAEMSIQRMQDSATPMPPDGAKADDLAILQSWIAAGMPQSTATCDATPGMSFYDTPPTCSSTTTWDDRGRVSLKLMRPGEACVQCHVKERGPRLFAGGTVYPTAHEPDNCYGVASGGKVILTGPDKVDHIAPINGSGNFYLSSAVPTPYTARVVSADGKKSRIMKGKQTNGDCNLCHTEAGTKLPNDKQPAAPGRVMAP